MKESVDDEAPPKEAARPPPFPDWSRMMTTSITARIEITAIKNPYIAGSLFYKTGPQKRALNGERRVDAESSPRFFLNDTEN
jgi:hypothetical protein